MYIKKNNHRLEKAVKVYKEIIEVKANKRIIFAMKKMLD